MGDELEAEKAVADLFRRGAVDAKVREEALVAAVRQLKEFADGVREGALRHGGVVRVAPPVMLGQSTLKKGRASVHLGESLVECNLPPFARGLRPGDVVLVAEGGQIVSVVAAPPHYGRLFTVTAWLGDGALEVDSERVVYFSGRGHDTWLPMPIVGARVLLDTTLTCVAKDLGKPEHKLAFTAETGITWHDIGGQEEAKRELREIIEGPIANAALYKEFGKGVTKGVLLYGPPGNGKTMFGKAAASAVRALFGAKAQASGFIYVKGPEVLNKYVGESESGVRSIFENARAHFAEHGFPAVVYIDEADALVGKRGSRESLGMESTIVPQFLAEMDGLEESHALIILATNRPSALDPAVVRDKRVDEKILVRRPIQAEVIQIIAMTLKGRPIIGDAAELAVKAAEDLFAARHGIAMIRLRRGADRRVTIADFVSGAMAVGIVERATKLAIRRHLAGEPKGITEADLLEAVRQTPDQVRKLDLSSELSDIVEELGGREDVKKIEPIH